MRIVSTVTSAFARARKLIACIATFLVSGIFLTACESIDYNSSGSTPQGKGGCSQPGPLTQDLLPTIGDSKAVAIKNPCLGYLDLVGQVYEIVPSGDDKKTLDGVKFTDRLRGFTGRLNQLGQASGLVECGYKTDRIALGLYQHRKRFWSIGVVAVIRGDFGAAADIAACFLLSQLPLLSEDRVRSANEEQNSPKFCSKVTRHHRNDEYYTVMWLGSSTLMCATLEKQLTPDEERQDQNRNNGILVTVQTKSDVAVRERPSTTASIIGSAANGSRGRVTCYSEGDYITTGPFAPTDRWARTTIVGVTGFISAAYLKGFNETKKC